jgi:hypothetical protein
MDKLSKRNLVRLIFVFAGLAYTAFDTKYRFPDEIHFGIMISLLAIIVEDIINREKAGVVEQKVSRIQEQAARAHKDLAFIKDRLELTQANLAVIQQQLAHTQLSAVHLRNLELLINSEQNGHIFGTFITALRSQMDSAISVQADQCTVEHPSLAIDSYYAFWNLLAELQKDSEAPCTVQAIHSCQMNIWVEHRLTMELLAAQQRFIDANGKIVRILCGHGETPSETIRAAAQQMVDVGIEVHYYDLDKGAVLQHNFAWDFMRIDDTKHAVIWDSFQTVADSPIQKAIYTQNQTYKGHNLARLWMEIDARSNKTPLDVVSSVPSHSTTLSV